MDSKIFTVTILRESSTELTAELHQQADAFKQSSCAVLGINLSALTILRSEHLGVLAIFFKTAEAKQGSVVILAPSDSLYEVLVVVRFDRKATIVRDEADFKKMLAAAEVTVTQAATNQKDSKAKPVAEDVKRVKQNDTRSQPAILATPAAASGGPFNKPLLIGGISTIGILVIIIGWLVSMVLMQHKELQALRQQSANAYILFKQQNDSLRGAVDQAAQESALLNELGTAPQPQGEKK